MRQSIIPWNKDKVVMTTHEFKSIEKKITDLVKVREALLITLEDATQKRYVGNEYRTYKTAVAEIEKKYIGKAEWGTVLTGSIIDLRAAFIMGQGVKIVTVENVSEKEAEKELEFARDLFEYNKLDQEMSVELAKEAEIEGKIALKVAVDKKSEFKEYEEMISIRFVSWIEKNYDVKTAKDDYMNYTEMKWTPTAKSKVETLKAPEFVYNKFGGRITKPNQAQPKVMKCLTEIDDVSKALRDWREINHIFATPIFDVECDDKEAVDDADAAITAYRMNIKKAFIHAKSKLNVIGPDMSGIDSLSKEIVDKIKIISGTTGIPVHFLGLLDLLKNRSTGDNTRELVIAGTQKERTIWKGTFKEMLDKSVDRFNEISQMKPLDKTKLDVEIPVYTQEQWDHIEKVLLPLYLASAISLEYLLSQVPNVDSTKELQRLEKDKEAQSEKDALTAERDAARDELALTKAVQPQPTDGDGDAVNA